MPIYFYYIIIIFNLRDIKYIIIIVITHSERNAYIIEVGSIVL